MLDRPAWLASEFAVLDLMNGKISDFRQEAVVTVVGDEIHISSTFKGTLKNGAAIAHDIRNVLTVKNGNIVKSVASSVDPGGPSEKLLLSIAMG